MTEKVDNFRMESVDNFDRNRWTTSNGTGGQLQTEWLVNFERNTHLARVMRIAGRLPERRSYFPNAHFRLIISDMEVTGKAAAARKPQSWRQNYYPISSI